MNWWVTEKRDGISWWENQIDFVSNILANSYTPCGNRSQSSTFKLPFSCKITSNLNRVRWHNALTNAPFGRHFNRRTESNDSNKRDGKITLTSGSLVVLVLSGVQWSVRWIEAKKNKIDKNINKQWVDKIGREKAAQKAKYINNTSVTHYDEQQCSYTGNWMSHWVKRMKIISLPLNGIVNYNYPRHRSTANATIKK